MSSTVRSTGERQPCASEKDGESQDGRAKLLRSMSPGPNAITRGPGPAGGSSQAMSGRRSARMSCQTRWRMALTVHLPRLREPEHPRQDDEDLAQRHGRYRDVARARDRMRTRAPHSPSTNRFSTNLTVRPDASASSHDSGSGEGTDVLLSVATSMRRNLATSDKTGSASSRRPSLMTPIQSARRSTSSMSCDEDEDRHGRSPPATSRMPCVNSSRTRGVQAGKGLVQDEQLRVIRERGHQRGLHPGPARTCLPAALVHLAARAASQATPPNARPRRVEGRAVSQQVRRGHPERKFLVLGDVTDPPKGLPARHAWSQSRARSPARTKGAAGSSSALIVVVFPAPFGPMSGVHAARRHLHRQVADGLRAAVAQRQAPAVSIGCGMASPDHLLRPGRGGSTARTPRRARPDVQREVPGLDDEALDVFGAAAPGAPARSTPAGRPRRCRFPGGPRGDHRP